MPNAEPPILLVLPEFIQTKLQVLKMVSELLQVEEFLKEAKHRQPGAKLILPNTTALLDKFADANKRNVLNHNQRTEMAHFLREVYKRAPVISLVLPLRADKAIVEAIIKWFRQNVHAQTLVQTSNHASIIGGTIVRIKHKTYDLSLAKKFDSSLSVLRSSLFAADTKQNNIQPASVAGRSRYF